MVNLPSFLMALLLVFKMFLLFSLSLTLCLLYGNHRVVVLFMALFLARILAFFIFIVVFFGDLIWLIVYLLVLCLIITFQV